MENIKPKRTRKIPIQIYVDDEELAIIESNQAKAEIKTKSDYIRQMAVFGKVISFDQLIDFKSCYNEIRHIGINLNQMAKVANETGSFFEPDIQMMKDAYGTINNYLNAIYIKLEELINVTKNGKFETRSELIRRLYDEK